jgi:hypothetical protein
MSAPTGPPWVGAVQGRASPSRPPLAGVFPQPTEMSLRVVTPCLQPQTCKPVAVTFSINVIIQASMTDTTAVSNVSLRSGFFNLSSSSTV